MLEGNSPLDSSFVGLGMYSVEKEALLLDASKKMVKHEALYGFCEVSMERSMIYSL